MTTTNEPNQFGFRVTHKATLEEWEVDSIDQEGRLGWSVKLPHQCDSWDIAGEDSYRVTHDDAITALAAFIAEAQEALAALKAGVQFGVTP